jgi:hypothetical protein
MLLDSNIIIYAFQPEYRKPNLQQLLARGKFSASAITRLEVMGFWRNTDQQFEQFALFFDAMRLFSVSDDIIERAIELRRQRSMGLADSIIAATALLYQLPLVTHNTRDFQWIGELELIDPLQEANL